MAQGTEWQAQVADTNNPFNLTVPQPGQAFSYLLSTVRAGTFGTRQVQSAPILARYPDTAYEAHGNYGITYNLSLPLYNASERTQTVALSLQTALKGDQPDSGLRFLQPPASQVFFRGTVRVLYQGRSRFASHSLSTLSAAAGPAGRTTCLADLTSWRSPLGPG